MAKRSKTTVREHERARPARTPREPNPSELLRDALRKENERRGNEGFREWAPAEPERKR